MKQVGEENTTNAIGLASVGEIYSYIAEKGLSADAKTRAADYITNLGEDWLSIHGRDRNKLEVWHAGGQSCDCRIPSNWYLEAS